MIIINSFRPSILNYKIKLFSTGKQKSLKVANCFIYSESEKKIRVTITWSEFNLSTTAVATSGEPGMSVSSAVAGRVLCSF